MLKCGGGRLFTGRDSVQGALKRKSYKADDTTTSNDTRSGMRERLGLQPKNDLIWMSEDSS
jgi:hypothetical protein